MRLSIHFIETSTSDFKRPKGLKYGFDMMEFFFNKHFYLHYLLILQFSQFKLYISCCLTC